MLSVAWHVPSPQSGEPFSVVEWFKASFEDCEENKVRRFGPDALDPHRAAPRSSQHPLWPAGQIPRKVDRICAAGATPSRAGTNPAPSTRTAKIILNLFNPLPVARA
jgi:hypothetical protein